MARRALVTLCVILFLFQTPFAKTLKIGTSMGLTGPYGPEAELLLSGIRLAFKEAEREGVINFKPVLVIYDDGYNPATTITNLYRLVNHDRVDLIFAVLGTPNAIAVAERLERLNQVLFFPLTGFSLLYHSDLSKRIFTLLPSYEDETKQLTKLAHKNGAKSVAVVYLSNLYGFDVVNSVEAQGRSLGMKVYKFPFDKTADNIKEIADRIASLAPDAVIIAIPEEYTGNLIQEFTKKSFYPALYGEFFSALPNVIMEMPTNKVRRFKGIYISMFIPTLNEDYSIVKMYKKAVAKYEPDGFPNYPELQGYFMGRTLLEILYRVGNWEDTNELIKLVETIKDMDVGLPEHISYGPNDHVGLTKAFIYRWKDGKKIPVK